MVEHFHLYSGISWNGSHSKCATERLIHDEPGLVPVSDRIASVFVCPGIDYRYGSESVGEMRVPNTVMSRRLTVSGGYADGARYTRRSISEHTKQ